MKKVLFVGGTFGKNLKDENCSSIVKKMCSYLQKNYKIQLDIYNG